MTSDECQEGQCNCREWCARVVGPIPSARFSQAEACEVTRRLSTAFAWLMYAAAAAFVFGIGVGFVLTK